MLVFVFVLILLSLCHASKFTFNQMEKRGCTYKLTSTDLNAEVVIGALFPVHAYNSDKDKYVFNSHGITWVESFLFSIDAINKNKTLLPGVKLGFDIRDSCSDEEIALAQSLEFMIDTKYMRTTSGRSWVPYQNESMCLCPHNKTTVMAAVIGEASSPISRIMSKLLSTELMPQISYTATSPKLGDKTIFRSFLRTTPSDLHQTQTIADLLYHFNWTYVSALASDDDYGRLALNNLREAMALKGMCLAIDHTFDPRFPGRDLEKLIALLKTVYMKTNVVVLWCKVQEAIQILEAANKAGLNNITWIGTETWGNDFALLRTPNITNWRIIGIKLTDMNVPSFRDHLWSVQRRSNFPNPWFDPLWDFYSFCPDGNRTRPANCWPLIPSGSFLPLNKHQNVMSAVYAVAYGLHSYFKCQKVNGTGICIDKDKPMNYEKLLYNIKKAQFTIPTNSFSFKFNSEGNMAFSSYEFTFFQEEWNKKRKKTSKKFVNFGEWNGQTNKINKVDATKIPWYNNSIKPDATCSFDCKPGYYIITSPVSCCWKCIQCSVDEISTSINQKSCQTCKKTEINNNNHTKCLTLENKNISLYSITGQVFLAASLLGILSVIFIVVIFLKNWETPVVKSSSREMSIIQLLSILLLFCLPVLHIVDLTPPLCVAQTACFGTLYSQIIAFIVIKTYRLLCVFKKKKFSKISKYLKNRYQILLSFIFVLVQLIPLSAWYAIHSPHIELARDKGRNYYAHYCGKNEDFLLYALICYISILSLASGFMAFRARKLPENFNEAHFIWFAMFTTCLTWLLFLPLHLSLDRARKPIVFLAVNMVSNFCLLYILYGYKISILMCYPELNTQAHFCKMATNATVTTFLKEVDPTGIHRPREQSVISFDFDGMFEEYHKNKKGSSSFPTRKMTINLKTRHFHFPSKKKIQARFGSRSKNNSQRPKKSKERHRTVHIPKDTAIANPLTPRSISLDDMNVYRQSSHNTDNIFNFEESPDSIIKQINPTLTTGTPKEETSSPIETITDQNKEYIQIITNKGINILQNEHSNSFDSDIFSLYSTNSTTALLKESIKCEKDQRINLVTKTKISATNSDDSTKTVDTLITNITETFV